MKNNLWYIIVLGSMHVYCIESKASESIKNSTVARHFDRIYEIESEISFWKQEYKRLSEKSTTMQPNRPVFVMLEAIMMRITMLKNESKSLYATLQEKKISSNVKK